LSSAVKIAHGGDLLERRLQAAEAGLDVVCTNGCFDLLHPGHVSYLEQARRLGDILLVALNSDDSVRRLKGAGRPVQRAGDRCRVVAGLACVDWVTTFDEDTPFELIQRVIPDVLVKGGDWPIDQIVGRDIVEANGGRVLSIHFEEGYSTTDIIGRIRSGDAGP